MFVTMSRTADSADRHVRPPEFPSLGAPVMRSKTCSRFIFHDRELLQHRLYRSACKTSAQPGYIDNIDTCYR
jgi:hypothetical protein